MRIGLECPDSFPVLVIEMRGNRGIIRQFVDLWPCYLGAIPSGTKVSVQRPSQTCEWLTIDGSKGASQARLFVDGSGEIALCHGVPVQIPSGTGSVQISADESDRTSVASLVWSDTPVVLEAPFARVVTIGLTPDPGSFVALSGPVAIQSPRDTALTIFFQTTNAAGNLQWSQLADTGVATLASAPTLIVATGAVQTATIAVPTAGATIVFAPDVAAGNTRFRCVSGVVQ